MRKLHSRVVRPCVSLWLTLSCLLQTEINRIDALFSSLRTSKQFLQQSLLVFLLTLGSLSANAQILCVGDPVPAGPTSCTTANGNMVTTVGNQAGIMTGPLAPFFPCSVINPGFGGSTTTAPGWFTFATVQTPLPFVPLIPGTTVETRGIFARIVSIFPFVLEFEQCIVENTLFGIDDADPIVFCGPTPTAECSADVGAAAAASLLINDCSPTTTVVNSITPDPIPGCGSPLVATVEMTVSDDCGNSTDITCTVNVEDTTPPTIACPADQDRNFDAACEYVVEDFRPLATLMDNCDDVLDPNNIVQTPAPGTTITGACGPTIQMITLEYTDCNGNGPAMCMFNLTITDITPPVAQPANCPGPVILNADDMCMVTVPDLRAANLFDDGCDPVDPLNIVQDPAPGAVLDVSALVCADNTIDVTFTYTDCNTNGPVTFTCPDVLDVRDITPPDMLVSCPAVTPVFNLTLDPVTCSYTDVTVPADFFNMLAVVSDNCDGDPLERNNAITFDCNDLGTQAIEIFGEDCSGNVSGVLGTCDVIIQVNPDDANWTNPGPLCSTDGEVDLNTFVTGEDCGTWNGDIVTPGDMASGGGIFNATTAGPGVYSVTYRVGNADCHIELTRAILVDQNFDPVLIDDFSVCWTADEVLDLETLLDAGVPEGGVWTIVSQTPVLGGPTAGGITLLPAPGNDHVIRYDGGCIAATIEYELEDCAGNVETDQIVLTIQQAPVATFDVPSEFCQDEGPFFINNAVRTLSGCNDYDVMFEVVGGPAGNDLIGGAIVSGPITGFPPVMVNPAVTAGRYRIRLTISDPNGVCPDVVHEEAVVIHADAVTPNDIVNAGPICESDAFPIALNLVNPNDVAGNPLTAGDIRFFGLGVIDGPGTTGRLTPPDTDGDGLPGPGTFSVCVNVGDARCLETYCEDFVINDDVEDPDLVADFALCVEPDDILPLASLLDADDLTGGVWSISAGPTGTLTGIFDANNAVYQGGCGTVTLQYVLPNDCNPPATPAEITITFNERPDIDLVAQGPLCVLDAPTIIANNATVPVCGSFGTFTGPGITDNGDGTATFNPAAAGEGVHTIDYTIMTAIGCEATGSAQVTVYAASDATFALADNLCVDDAVVALTLTNPDPSVLGGGSVVPPTEDGNVEVSWDASCGACLTDNGDGTASFDPAVAGEGTFLICAYTGDPSCQQSSCDLITVHAGIDATLVADVARGCFDFSASGGGGFTDFDLAELYTAGTTQGGVWSYVGGPGAAIRGEIMSALPGCHQLRYTVEAAFVGADGECAEMSDDVFVLLGEEPQPEFDLAQEVCWDGVGGSISLPTLYNGSTFGTSATRTYAWVASLTSGVGPIPTFSDATAMEPMVEIQGAGLFEICLTERLDYAACGTNGPTFCSTQICHQLAVTETAIEVIPTWTNVGPFCEDDARVYLGAASAGAGVGQVTGNPDGVFTGVGVQEDPASSGEYYFNPVTAGEGSHTVCYTVSNGAGCTATECHTIEVFPGVTIDGPEFTALECASTRVGFNFFSLPDGSTIASNYTPGQYNLQDILSPDSKLGGTWALVSTPTPSQAFGANPIARIFGGNLYYSDPGCYEVTYSVECFPGADGACVASETFFVQIGEAPSATFDMPYSYCLEDGDLPFTLDIGLYFDETVFHPTSTRRRSYRFTSSDAAVITPVFQTRTASADFMPQIVGQGTVEICVLEGLNSAPGGMCGATETFCPTEYCQTITIVSASETLDPSWDPAGPFCVDDICIELDDLVTGTPNGVFTGPGVSPDPANPDYQFCPATAGIGSHVVTYTVATPEGCESSFSRTIVVEGAVDASLQDAHVMCQIAPSSTVGLSVLFTNTTTPGGTFTLLNGPGTGLIAGGVLIYGEAGCYEIQYEVEAFPGADGLCLATETAFLLISEEPQPNFDIQDQVCFSDGDADVSLTPTVNSPTYDAASTLSSEWTITDNVTGATATIDATSGLVTISDEAGAATITGTIEVCYEEELEWAACGTIAASTAGVNGDGCAESICMIITVEDGTALDASFTVSNMEPCPGEVVTLTANVNGGVFTGPGVTDNGNGSTATLQIGECGVYAATYTLSSPGGCTNSYTANITTDRTDPRLNPPADLTVECDGAGNTAEMQAWLDQVTGSDNCSFSIDTILFNRISGCHSNVGAYVYQFIATDTCNNATTAFATFTIEDTEPPVIVGGADMDMEECTAPPAGNFPDFDFWLADNAGATADDVCGDRVIWTNDFDPANWVTTCGNARFVDVTFYAEDECGNVDSIMNRFTIGDGTPPVFSNCPRPEITASAPATWCSAFVNFSPPAATDNCSGVTLTRLDVTGLESGDLFPVGITVLTWEARDECDNADTCSLKVIVNDFHTPPSFACPGDTSSANDPGMCGADVAAQLGVDLSSTDIEDNCPDNLAITWEVEDENGDLVGCGIESVNGFVFPVGQNTVTYHIQDQPILLITEIVQEGADAVEITNFGPASMEISCLNIERTGTGAEVHIVPINTVLMAGQTYVAALMNDIGYSDPATYSISIKGTVFDEISTNGGLDGGDIWRTIICDHDTEDDWLVTVECKASLGMINPGLPVFPSNGTKTGIQTVLPSEDTCDFMVTVSDTEAPSCTMSDTVAYTVPGIAGATGETCISQDFNVTNDDLIGGVILRNIDISYPDLTRVAMSLRGPDGTEVEVFNRPCTNVPNMLADFADFGTRAMSAAGCAESLNGAELWLPEEAFKAFYGKMSQGTWTLDLSVDGAGLVDIGAWTLEIIELTDFAGTPIVTQVDPNTAPDMCGDTVDWFHPIFFDNCCEGSIAVEYTTLDADTLPMGGPVMSGAAASEFFGLGTTTVTYTLTDDAGNTSMCSFDVIVEDPLGLCVPPCASDCQVSCIQDINVSLNENCEVPVVPSMVSEDISDDCNFYYEIEIRDEHGNLLPSDTLDASHVGHCFTVTLIEPECGNSCWTRVCVEDKFPPIIECVNDTMNCIEYQFGYAEPIVTEHCQGYTLHRVDEIITNLDCDPGYQKLVTQKWVAIDDSGNVSDTCEQGIWIERFPMGDIEGPVQDTILYCGSGFEELANGFPTPMETGVPMYDTLSLFPLPDFFCNMLTEYEDVPLGKVGCTEKIMRTWKVTEWWCREDSSRRFNQMITLVDTVSPMINVIEDTIEAKADQRSCDALVDLPVAQVDDFCNDIDRVDIVYPGGFLADQNGGQVRLEVGANTVVYRAYDECYNESTDTLIVIVDDGVAPIAVCEQNTVVTLDNDGVVHIYAETFDDGSFDECKLESMEVRRMVDNCASGTDQWGEYVEFCCADIGSEIMVAFRVTDKSGNMNTCMVRATVQDKQAPTVVGLPDITVDCRFDWDPNNLDVFGKFVFDPALRDSIIIDAEKVEIMGEPLDGVVYDNCPPVVEERLDTSGLSNCGLGFIVREFTFTDNQGNSSTASQRIDIDNDRPFTEAQIDWPNNIDTANVCGANNLRPQNLTEDKAFPRFIDEDECSLVGYDYKDELIDASLGNEACYKIIRTWTVIDWCQVVNGVHPKWTYDQVIEVKNTLDPIITSDCADTVRCVYNNDCEPEMITLIATAEDSCTASEDLFWQYKIDTSNDGTYDIFGQSNDATGIYPIGVHRIKFIVEDLCGNRDSCSYIFEIRNCKAPTAYCKNGLVAELTPMDLDNDGTPDTEMAEVWASDLDEGSHHVCGHPVVLSFSADTSDKVRMYDCDSLMPPIRPVTIWVTDKITGNVSKCQTFVNVQDNNNVDVCPNTLSGGINGLIATEWDLAVDETEVALDGSTMSNDMTDRSGTYNFKNVPLGGIYEISPQKDGDDMNGVSTGDLIRIQRHLLGMTSLSSPYQFIAADVNNSESVSAADIAELRKLILGVYDELPNNTSWRFVDGEYNFPDPQDPWLEEFPEEYELHPFEQDMEVDFVGVKIGDINGDVSFGAQGTQTRSSRKVIVEDGAVQAGRMYEVMFNMEDLSDLEGFQFTMEWNAEMLELSELIPNLSLGMNLSNFNMSLIEEGMVTTSWNSFEEIDQGEERLFAVRFTALEDGRLSEMVNISGRLTTAEAYVRDMDVSTPEAIELTFTGGAQSNYFALYQNEPNPWNETTVVGFHIPTADQVRMTIFDETGRLVNMVEEHYNAGYNEIQLNASDLYGKGVLYYRLETKGHTATRKMILID